MKKFSLYAIVSLMAFVAVVFFIRTYVHVPSCDEVIYQYVWEKDDPEIPWRPDHRFERKVSSIEDIVQTQVIHYNLVNGRSLVHAVEQAFTDHELAFAIVNTLVFLLFIVLIIRFVSAGSEWKRSYLLWFSIVLCLLFLFPYQESLWTSVNYGLNYLWPAVITMIFLSLWERIIKGEIRKTWYAPMALLALIAGWTHEAFTVAIAGGTFLYYCFNFKRFRGAALWLCIPLWLSSCVMVFAPGNLIRYFHGTPAAPDPTFLGRVFNGFDNVLHLWMFWLLVVGVIFIFVSGNKSLLKEFCKNNMPLLLVFIVGFLFSLIANTGPNSHIMVELIALLMILKFTCLFHVPTSKTITIVEAIVSLLFVAQQCWLVYEVFKVEKYHKEILEAYIHKDENVFLQDHVSPLSRPYVRIWSGKYCDLYVRVFRNVFHKKNRMELLKEADLSALSNPDDFFIEENKVAGTAYVYQAPQGDYYWLNPDSLRIGDKFEAELKPVDFSHNVQLLVKIKFALFPHLYEKTQTLEIDTIDSQYGRAYRIHPLPVRRIQAVNLIRD